tara:strand:+ start:547 stop:1062 length:516 start_codon:yes stop_codon:yes gene_type:complete
MNYKEKFKNIKNFVFDVDGVLTNGGLYILPSGEFMRKMNAKDGYALKLALIKGYNIAIITGGKENNIKERLNKLGIKNVFLNAHNKLPILENYLTENNLNIKNTLYMGDDIPDIECIQKVYVSSCPNDAVYEVKEASDFISSYKGGEGCVRDVIEQVLRINNDWEHEAFKY